MSPPRSRRTPLDPETLRPRGRHQRAIRRRRRKRGAIVAVTAIVALAVAAAVGSTAAVVAYGSSCDLDSLRSVRLGANSFVFAADGSLLGSIPAERNRQPVSAADMSLWVRKATIAIEDRRFLEHGGVDLQGIARAAVADVRAGQIVEGGSTITQQLVRNLYISRERTVQRKVKEACLATKLDRAWSKQRILTTYLNQVYYGNHAYGIEAAAETYFSMPASRLDLSQAALLAGLTQAPSNDDPFTAPGRALARRREVLDAMLDTRSHHAAHLPEGARGEGRAAPGQALQQDPRAVLLRLRARPADPGVRRGDRPLRRAQGVHDDRAALPAAGGAGDPRDADGADGSRGGAHLDQPALRRDPRHGGRHPEPSEERVQPPLAGAPPAGIDVQDVRPDRGGRAGDQSGLDVLRLGTLRLQDAPRRATATTAAGGAFTRTRTTTTGGARSAAQRCARTTPCTRS